MPRLVAFLRAVNVGGRIVKMERLRTEFESLGFGAVETFIASGNVIFETRAKPAPALAGRIEERLRVVFDFEIATFLRTAAEVAAVAAARPFAASRIAAASTWAVGFLAAPPGRDAAERLMALRSPEHDLHLDGRDLYWLSTLRQGESKLNNGVFERALGAPLTVRSMSTMAKLAARLVPGAGSAKKGVSR